MSGTPPCRPQGVSQTLPQQVGILPIALHYFLFVTQAKPWVGSLCATIGLRIPFFDGVGLELHHLVTHTAEFLP